MFDKDDKQCLSLLITVHVHKYFKSQVISRKHELKIKKV